MSSHSSWDPEQLTCRAKCCGGQLVEAPLAVGPIPEMSRRRRSLCFAEALRLPNIQHLDRLLSHTPPTSADDFSPLPIGPPWLLSLRHVGCRHALRRSSCAATARGEVRIPPIGHETTLIALV